MMKALILAFFLLVAYSTTSLAQCGKNVKMTASKTTYLNSNGDIQRSVDEASTIRVHPAEVIIHVNNEHRMTCAIKSVNCNWSVPYKEGKTVITAAADKDGESKNVTFTIDGKRGKVTFLLEIEGQPDHIISVDINKFEEED